MKSVLVKSFSAIRNLKSLRKAVNPIYITALVLWIIGSSAYASFSEIDLSLNAQECLDDTSVISVLGSITQNPFSFIGFGNSAASDLAAESTTMEFLSATTDHQAAQPESIALVALFLLLASLIARRSSPKSGITQAA